MATVDIWIYIYIYIYIYVHLYIYIFGFIQIFKTKIQISTKYVAGLLMCNKSSLLAITNHKMTMTFYNRKT